MEDGEINALARLSILNPLFSIFVFIKLCSGRCRCCGRGGGGRRGFGTRLGPLHAVFRAAHAAFFHAGGVESSADDMIPHAGQVLHPSSSNENNGVFLEVMANTRDVGSYFNAIGQPNTRHFSKGRVGFLRSRRIDTDTDPPLLRRSG